MTPPESDNLVLCSSEDIDPPQWLPEAEATAYRVLELRGLSRWELSLHFCNDTAIRVLNRQYRGKDKPTDVLSFGGGEDFPVSGDARYIAGDIIISVETLTRNAAADGIPLKTELKRLIIHGILHLCGYDHDENNQTMLRMQEDLLKVILEE